MKRIGIRARHRGIAGALFLAGTVLVTAPAPAQSPSAPIVRAPDGPVQGAERDGLHIFLGIPYAAPPIGPLRLRPPKPVAKWTQMLDATKPSPRCYGGGPAGSQPNSTQSEDCLYLSIMTPANAMPGQHLPVMVLMSNYDGTQLAQKGVLVINLNYRYGLLGLMAAPALDEPGVRSGNYTIRDQQEALRWVQRNIAAFGGDPKNVTLFGQSQFGGLAFDQMISPPAKGLFAKVMVDSDPGTLLIDRKVSYSQASDKIIEQLGCASRPDVGACLRDLPLAAFGNVKINKNLLRIVQDDDLLPMDTYDAFMSGKYNRVPVLLGSNIHEGATWVTGFERGLGHPMRDSDLPSFAKAEWGEGPGWPDMSAVLLAEYPLNKYPTPDMAMMNAATDYRMACPVDSARRNLSKYSTVYGYEMTEPDPDQNFPGKDVTDLHNTPYHGSEMSYIFGKRNGVAFTGRAAALSERFQTAWVNFLKFGSPDPTGKEWPTFTAAHPVLMNMEVPPKTSTDFVQRHNCAWMEQQHLVERRLRTSGGTGVD